MAKMKERLMLGGIRRLLNGTARMSRKHAGKIGYYLLSKPRRFPEDPANEEFVDLAEQETFCDENGTEIYCYHWRGEGPKVLLLHGWESYTGRWYPFYQPLIDAGYDVYAFDAPGHGRSGGKRFNALLYRDSLRSYLDRLGFSPDFWICHSAGAMAAMIYLKERPQYEPSQFVSLALPGKLMNFIDKFCEVVGVHDKVKEGIDQQFRRKLELSMKDIDFIEYASYLRVPGLIIHDHCDELAPVTGAEQMHANWKGSSLITTRDCGHSLSGDLVPAMVLEYLRHSRGSR